uniref:Geminin DNA replication inhibitor n=1 Tax=Mola mola TaxID=94237 RepID=A0A3Q3X2E1_MOLML
ARSQKDMGPTRQTLQVLQASAVNKDFGRSAQMSKAIPKRKQWSTAQIRGPKRVKVEVKSTQTEETQRLTDGMTNEAYELMVKGIFISTTNKLNLHKDIEAKDEQITKLKCENEELQELAKHVQYMADMIERLTGKSPDNLEELREMALGVEEDEHEDSDVAGQSEEEDAEEEEETSDREEAGPSRAQDCPNLFL